MTPSEIKLDLLVVDKEADAERLDELTVRLMRDLRELGAESVERSPGEDVPDGAKGDAFTVSALALVAVPAKLPSLVNFLQTWSLRINSSCLLHRETINSKLREAQDSSECPVSIPRIPRPDKCSVRGEEA